MENKNLGTILLVVSIVLALSIVFVKANEDRVVNEFIQDQGTCFLKDGTCLHDRNLTFYIIGWAVCAGLASLGAYLILFDKSQKAIMHTLEKQKQIQTDDERFSILMRGLTADEQKVIKAVKDQEGITQQTLRLRTDLHKSKLSIVLDGLEKKGLIARTNKGKTKEVFLKEKI
jgi:ribosomal protein S25